MRNPDCDSDADKEASLESLLADCDEALARGEDPTALWERLGEFGEQERQRFFEAFTSLRAVRSVVPTRSPELSLPRAFGKFRLLEVLGQGGFGLVFLAEDTALGRKVALKVPRLHTLAARESAERLAREAQAAARLEHPHLTSIFEIGQIEGLTYLASAYCAGPTLAQWLKAQSGLVPIRAAAELVEVLAHAAAYMHGQGVLHRDLKPSNVLLFPKQPDLHGADWQKANLDSFTPKITDFGLARQDDRTNPLSRTGTIVGTAAYMAPEQAWGAREDIGPAADIYALGVVLYELLVGLPPFHGDNDLETLHRAKEEEPLSPRRLRPDTPRDLETICLRCLEKRPARRYPSMTALAEDLHRFLQGRVIAARPVGWIERTGKWMRRQPKVAALTGLAVFLVLALLVGSVWLGWREHRHGLNLQAALDESRTQKELAEQREGLARNQSYASHIRRAWDLQRQDRIDLMGELLRTQLPQSPEKDLRGFEWHYLWRLGRSDFVLRRHMTAVTSVAYSRDGRWCASGGRDKSIHLWETANGKLVKTLEGHALEVRQLSFLDNDQALVSAGFNRGPDGQGFLREILVWSLASGQPRWRRGPEAVARDFQFNQFALAATGSLAFALDQDHLLRINLDNGESTKLCACPDARAIATSSQGDVIAMLDSRQVELIDSRTGKTLRQRNLDSTPGRFESIELAPHGQTLAIGWSQPYCVDLWDVPSLTKQTTRTLINIPWKLVFDSQGRRLAVVPFLEAGQEPGPVVLCQVPSGQEIEFRSLDFPVEAAAFSPTADTLAFGSNNGLVHLQTLEPEQEQQDLPGPLPRGEAWSVAFAHQGTTLVAGYDHESGLDRATLQIWDLRRRRARSWTGHRGTVFATAIDPQETTLATASYDRTVRLWDLASGQCRCILEGHAKPVRAVAWSPDGARLASAGSDRTIMLWNAADGTLLKSWRGHDQTVRAVAFSPNGQWLVSAGNDQCIHVWNTATGDLVHTMKEEDKIQGLACAPVGNLIAVANEQHMVKLWDMATGTLVRSLPGHTDKVRCVVFSPDGMTLASGGDDRTVRLWHVVTGQELLTLSAEHIVNQLTFDRSNKSLAAALHDGRIRIW